MEKLKSAQVIMGVPDIGLGKPTFAAIVSDHIRHPEEGLQGLHVVRFTPEDADRPTRSVWRGMQRLYETPWLQSAAGGHRASGEVGFVDRAVLTAANRGIIPALEASDGVFATVHAFLGKDMRTKPSLRRVVVEGDYQLEPMAVDAHTKLLVPTDETREQALNLAKERGVKQDVTVTGFLVPRELLKTDRPKDLIDFYSQGMPTKDNPLRISYMMTGQGAHLPELQVHILQDPFLADQIRKGRVKVDVFTAKNGEKAEIAAQMARESRMSTLVSTTFDPKNEAAVQVIWSPDPQTAVANSIAMAEHGHLLITPAAERIGWAGTMPYVPLRSVRGNEKMRKNTQFLAERGLTGPTTGVQDMAETINELYANGGRFVEEHFERAHDVFDGKLDGGAKAAAHIIEVYNQRKAA